MIPGRKPRPRQKTEKRAVNFYPSEWEALRRLAFEERTTVSAQVRRAVAEYLKRRRGKGLQR